MENPSRGLSSFTLTFIISTWILGIVSPLKSENQLRSLELKFPIPIVLDQIWTYRADDGLEPPNPGIVFWLGVNDQRKERYVAVTSERVLSQGGFQNLLNTGLKRDDPELFYQGSAAPRDAFFHRMDLDADGIDEVLLTGRGGAGGTSLLQIFKIPDDKATLFFSDSSRFGFRLFDKERDGFFELANPGFEFIVDESTNTLQPKQFTIYHIQGKKYVKSDKIPVQKFHAIVKKFEKVTGVPLSTTGKSPVIRVHH